MKKKRRDVFEVGSALARGEGKSDNDTNRGVARRDAAQYAGRVLWRVGYS